MNESTFQQYQSLPESDQEVIRLALYFEHCVRQRGKPLYRAFPARLLRPITTHPTFRQFAPVAKWFRSHDMPISLTRTTWMGFVDYVFQESPSIPYPGQLRNEVLLGRYLSGDASAVKAAPLTPERKTAMLERYKHIMDPDDFDAMFGSV